MENLRIFFKDKKNLTTVVILLLLVVAIPLAVYLSLGTQVFKPKAVGEAIELIADPCVFSLNPNKVGCLTFPIKLTSPFGLDNVSTASAQPSVSSSASAAGSATPSSSPPPSPSGSAAVSPSPSATLGQNILLNGDFADCNTNRWTAWNDSSAVTNIATSPGGADQSGCSVSFNCNATSPANTCNPFSSIFQDVNIFSLGGKTLRFGGKFATTNGSAAVDLIVFELNTSDSSLPFGIVTKHNVTINATTTFQDVSDTFVVNANTKTLRFQLYPRTGETFKADNLFIQEQTQAFSPSLRNLLNNLLTNFTSRVWAQGNCPGSNVGENEPCPPPSSSSGSGSSTVLPPTGVTATLLPACNNNKAQVKVTWINPSGVKYSKIERSKNNGTSWELASAPGYTDGNLATPASQYTDSQVDLSSTYIYRVTSAGTAANPGLSAPSSPSAAVITPASCAGSSASPSAIASNPGTPTPYPSSPTTTQCNDGVDNNGNGLVDAKDPSCHQDNDSSNAVSYNSALVSEQTFTVKYRLADSETTLSGKTFSNYTSHPTTTNFTLPDASPGTKQIWVEFVDNNNRSIKSHISVELIDLVPEIAGLNCSLDIAKKSLNMTLDGIRFGAGAGKVGANDKDLEILSWKENQITAKLNNPGGNFDQNQIFKVKITRNDNKISQEVICKVGTSLLSLGARLFCREPGKFDVSDVAVVIVDENGSKVEEKVSIDSNGIINNLRTKLQSGKLYAIAVKAPNSLRRTAQFSASEGTTVISASDFAEFILPVGDIAPVILADGKINAVDRAELTRQWSLLGIAQRKTGDLNRDTRINSVDWACMRYDFNKEDDSIPIKAEPPTKPSPSPSPSCRPRPACLDEVPRCSIPESSDMCPKPSLVACPTPPVCPAGKTLLHGDPADLSCPAYICVDIGSGQRAAYFLLQPENAGTYANGQEFTVDLAFWSPNETVNLLVGKLSFDPSALEVVKIDKGGIISCFVAPCPSLDWIEDTFDNQVGTISLVAGTPSPGLQTTADGSPFAKVTFKAKKVGITNVAVTDASNIYSNSDNANILGSLVSSQIAIVQ